MTEAEIRVAGYVIAALNEGKSDIQLSLPLDVVAELSPRALDVARNMVQVYDAHNVTADNLQNFCQAMAFEIEGVS